jgi:hypothetical protein
VHQPNEILPNKNSKNFCKIFVLVKWEALEMSVKSYFVVLQCIFFVDFSLVVKRNLLGLPLPWDKLSTEGSGSEFVSSEVMIPAQQSGRHLN